MDAPPLVVTGLTKHYPEFTLDHVSFEVPAGRVVGFVGRNGAGKSTTLKSMLNFVHPDKGSVRFFGLDFAGHEDEIKQRLGFTSGAARFYPRQRLATITDVYRRFFPHWDEPAYRHHLERFALVESKKVSELSEGMRVKYALALALSHGAHLLLLDEPTSGLDPVSRDELLDVFRTLVDEGGVSILFSTQIMSDLQRSADDIVYIQRGRIIAACPLEDLLERYVLVTAPEADVGETLRSDLIGARAARGQIEGLLAADRRTAANGLPTSRPDLDRVMVHLEREAAA